MLTLSILIYYMNKCSNPLGDSSVNFNLSRFRVEGGTPTSPITPKVINREGRVRGQFLKGPIPWNWITCAMRLPGKALHVAVVLWQEAGFRKSRHVKFRMSKIERVGFSRWTARRALVILEEAKLIKIGRKPGQLLQVEILEVEESIDEQE
jgi:hypothetical protein